MSLMVAFRHISLLVADLQRARDFYEGILGLEINQARPTMSFAGVWYDIGSTQIHLMCLPNPEAGLVRPEHGGRDRHAAFVISDMHELKERLTKADIHFTLSQSGRGALFCRDPDGNALEFICG
ncbi:glyoxalase [Sulfuriferula sp. AH1]|uniref:VOC family protein n=1 Tax=Sulfuriferula sp. AH1 TaxID=1985873 RepID=UPI000B3B5A2B|nr:VOC family protein [Sulfuriferula sp. AH1]ARU31575.1 glyoxalase [Sulfuriferula sp. AH1]